MTKRDAVEDAIRAENVNAKHQRGTEGEEIAAKRVVHSRGRQRLGDLRRGHRVGQSGNTDEVFHQRQAGDGDRRGAPNFRLHRATGETGDDGHGDDGEGTDKARSSRIRGLDT